MKKFTDAVYTTIYAILKYIVFIFALLLLLSTLIFTCYIDNMETQKVLTRTDNILLSVLGCSIFLILLNILTKWAEKNASFRCRLLLCITIGWYLFASAILLLFCKTAPSGDPMVVFRIAEQCAAGNLVAIHPTASYLSYYPHQIGLIAYYEVILRFWNLLPIDIIGYHFIKVLNVFWTCLMIFCQYKTINHFFHNTKVNTVYLFLTICNIPLLFYTSFVYGEIPSISLFSLGYFCVIKIFELIEESPGPKRNYTLCFYTFLSFAAFIGCIALRKNAMILMIAVIGVTLFELLRHRKIALLGILAVYVVITVCTLPSIRSIYEKRAGNELNDGVTALSYIAMGMQESTRADGWYNGFNFLTYENAKLDQNLANEISKNAITKRLQYFKENPSYVANFYLNKYRSQWCDGTYACLQATLCDLGGRRQIFTNLYSGKYDSLFIPYCSLLQLLTYLGATVFAFLALTKKITGQLTGYPLFLGFIGVFGAFLFHMLWEANARYIFPYSLLLIPYAAFGLAAICSNFSRIKQEKGESNH